jgi:hypothetical protein
MGPFRAESAFSVVADLFPLYSGGLSRLKENSVMPASGKQFGTPGKKTAKKKKKKKKKGK